MKACQKGCLPQDDTFFIQWRLIHLILNLEPIQLLEVLLWNTCVVPTPAENEWWSLKLCETQDSGNLPWRSSTTCVLKRFIRQSETQLSVLGIPQWCWTILSMKPTRFEPTAAQLLLQPLHSILDGKKRDVGDSERLSLAKNSLAPRRWLMALALWQHPICKSSPVCGNALVGSPR